MFEWREQFDRGINFFGGRVYQSCICFCRGSDCIRIRVKIHRSENGMDQRAEPSARLDAQCRRARPFYLYTRQIRLAETCTRSKRGGCLDFNRGAARLRDCRRTALLPSDVGLLAASHLGAALVGL